MIDTKITAPGVERTEDGRDDFVLQGQYITTAVPCQSDFRVFPLLPQGEARAITTRELCSALGLTNRALRAKIEAERLAGAQILSTVRGHGGYFRPSDGEAGREELLRYCATLRARALNTLRTLRTARKALGDVVGQMQLEVEDDGARETSYLV